MGLNSREKDGNGEEWRPVVGYEGYYEVSVNGKVRSIDRIINHPRLKRAKRKGRDIVLYQSPHNGYVYADLCKEGKATQKRVHKLVAEAYLGEKTTINHQINHKNGNKADNRAENLEWCTQSQNMKHAYATNLERATWSRQTIRLDDGKVYGSIKEAAIDVNGQESKVWACCNGKRKHHHGYRFAYYEGVVPCL